jgi:signal recognition particle subunit SEC65
MDEEAERRLGRTVPSREALQNPRLRESGDGSVEYVMRAY